MRHDRVAAVASTAMKTAGNSQSEPRTIPIATAIGR